MPLREAARIPSAGNSHATLVLECRTCHFSTDAFNSVLIAQPNLRGIRRPKSARPREYRYEKKSKEERQDDNKKQRGRHHVTQEAFSPSICCCHCTVIRSTHHRP